MIEVIFQLVGGIGLFLIGMGLLTSGLVAFSGGALQRALARFTGTPTKAFFSGALLTALVQSSTATTATLIGFVSAGFITFSQAVGVVIGASLGSTATGWLVATVGLKLNIGLLTLPLIGVGALIKILGKGRSTDLGLALTGFGLLFLGLSVLQEGMHALSGIFRLAELPTGGIGARILMMVIGFAMTAILQSSSAAIATVLTALDTGNINFEQAAALAVGAAIGTTLTGALLAIGGTIHAKRTVLAHILFNTATGLIAIISLPIFLLLIDDLGHLIKVTPGPTGLAAFHTLFIGLGVLIFLPFTVRFANLVQRLLPNKSPDLTEHLDDSLLHLPDVALDASQRALEQTSDQFMLRLCAALTQPQPLKIPPLDLVSARQSLDNIFSFITRITLASSDETKSVRRIAQLHAVDHLMRLRNRLQDLSDARILLGQPIQTEAQATLLSMLKIFRENLSSHTLGNAIEQLSLEAGTVTTLAAKVRQNLLTNNNSASSQETNSQLLHLTDSMRWLERTAQHIWRIGYYLSLGESKSHPETLIPSIDANI
jgi:phosphate:Na+ symporter